MCLELPAPAPALTHDDFFNLESQSYDISLDFLNDGTQWSSEELFWS